MNGVAAIAASDFLDINFDGNETSCWCNRWIPGVDSFIKGMQIT